MLFVELKRFYINIFSGLYIISIYNWKTILLLRVKNPLELRIYYIN